METGRSIIIKEELMDKTSSKDHHFHEAILEAIKDPQVPFLQKGRFMANLML